MEIRSHQTLQNSAVQVADTAVQVADIAVVVDNYSAEPGKYLVADSYSAELAAVPDSVVNS